MFKAQPLAKPAAEQLSLALLNWGRNQGVSAWNWSDSAKQLRLRVLCAAQWLPEVKWPAVDDDSLLDSLESWLLPALDGVRVCAVYRISI